MFCRDNAVIFMFFNFRTYVLFNNCFNVCFTYAYTIIKNVFLGSFFKYMVNCVNFLNLYIEES